MLNTDENKKRSHKFNKTEFVKTNALRKYVNENKIPHQEIADKFGVSKLVVGS